MMESRRVLVGGWVVLAAFAGLRVLQHTQTCARTGVASVRPGGGPLPREPGVLVGGRVVAAADSNGIEGAEIRLLESVEWLRACIRDPGRLLRVVPGAVARTRTDRNGAYRFPDVVPGSYSIVFSAKGREDAVLGQIRIRDVAEQRMRPVALRKISATGRQGRFAFDDVPHLIGVERAVPDEIRGRQRWHAIFRRGTLLLHRAEVASPTSKQFPTLTVAIPGPLATTGVRWTLHPVDNRSTTLATWYAEGRVRGTSVAFSDVSPGRYLCSAFVGERLRAAAIVTVEIGSAQHEPAWERRRVVCAADREIAVEAVVTLAVRAQATTRVAVAAIGNTVRGIFGAFARRAHKVHGDGVLWIALDDRYRGILVARAGDLVGQSTLHFGRETTTVELRRGTWLHGYRSRSTTDLVVERSDGWSEHALFPRSHAFRLGPYPPGEYVITCGVLDAFGAKRLEPLGVRVTAAHANQSLEVRIPTAFVGEKRDYFLYGWAPAGVDVFVYRDGDRNRPIKCEEEEGGFWHLRLKGAARSGQIVCFPRGARGPTFGTAVAFTPGVALYPFFLPETGVLRVMPHGAKTGDRVLIAPRKGPYRHVFIQPYRAEIDPDAPIRLPVLPLGTYEAQFFRPDTKEPYHVETIEVTRGS